MTKRDIATWFCQVAALAGIFLAAINLASDLIGWGTANRDSFVLFGVGIALSVFVWLFAPGIAAELAAEGEQGAPVASLADLRPLLLRCVGLWILLAGLLWFGRSLISVGIAYFSNSFAGYARAMLPNLSGGFLQSVLGFLLAFTPRIRAALKR